MRRLRGDAMTLLAQLCVVAGAVVFACAVVLHLMKIAENRRLDGVLQGLQIEGKSRKDAILAVNTWVYFNQGFAKNPENFLSPRLGPTPTDVLRHGGDCADKSRLTMALLDRARIPSTLAMLYGTADGPPTHVVVEASYEHGRMAVDPVFHIDFPADPEGKRYHGLASLRADPSILEQRVAELSRIRGATDDKVSYYKLKTEHYSHARTMNLDKNGLTRFVARAIEKSGQDPTLVPRPVILEDPIRLAAAGAYLVGLVLIALGWWLS